MSIQTIALKKAVRYLKELENITPELQQMSIDFKNVDISRHKGKLTALAVHLDDVIELVNELTRGKNKIKD